ncbi:hypothetical protein [Helicobacter marmotae]|uniref:hypothetical protein n=1 Tax=Helicobacter marmotae TaxID=152490 RepID=UPI00131576F5|nr:hypothetical protein [Helicobacter marmotae]
MKPKVYHNPNILLEVLSGCIDLMSWFAKINFANRLKPCGGHSILTFLPFFGCGLSFSPVWLVCHSEPVKQAKNLSYPLKTP